MKEIDAPYPDRSERVSVIGISESQKLSLRLLTAKLPVLKRLLQCDLDRGRTGVRIEDSCQAAWGDLDKRCTEPDAGFVTQAEECRVRNLVELVTQGAIQSWMVVSVKVAPQRADSVEVSPTIGVETCVY